MEEPRWGAHILAKLPWSKEGKPQPALAPQHPRAEGFPLEQIPPRASNLLPLPRPRLATAVQGKAGGTRGRPLLSACAGTGMGGGMGEPAGNREARGGREGAAPCRAGKGRRPARGHWRQPTATPRRQDASRSSQGCPPPQGDGMNEVGFIQPTWRAGDKALLVNTIKKRLAQHPTLRSPWG